MLDNRSNTVHVAWHSLEIYTCVSHLAEVALEQSALEAPVLLVGTTLVAREQLEVAAHQPQLIQVVRREDLLGKGVIEVFIWIHELVSRSAWYLASAHIIKNFMRMSNSSPEISRWSFTWKLIYKAAMILSPKSVAFAHLLMKSFWAGRGIFFLSLL